MSKSRFKVYSADANSPRFDGKKEATVTIDRGAQTFSVRPKHLHKEYTLPLSAVANMVIYGIIAAELREKKKAKKAKRRGSSR